MAGEAEKGKSPLSDLIAIDPGSTSGFVVLRSEDGSLFWAEELNLYDVIAKLSGWLKSTTTSTGVVYEQFRLYGGGVGQSKTFSDLPEVRIIGQIEYLCKAYEREVASVGAGVYKTATAQWLPPKELKGPHQKDAWRLGMWYHVVRLKGKATITLKNGRVYSMNVTEAEHEEVT